MGTMLLLNVVPRICSLPKPTSMRSRNPIWYIFHHFPTMYCFCMFSASYLIHIPLHACFSSGNYLTQNYIACNSSIVTLKYYCPNYFLNTLCVHILSQIFLPCKFTNNLSKLAGDFGLESWVGNPWFTVHQPPMAYNSTYDFQILTSYMLVKQQ